MEINFKYLFNDQEFENQYINITKYEKKHITFLDILKEQNKQDKRKFNVYEIAARIAKGENVSSEELRYIKENAPTLYRKAVMIYMESKQHKINKNSKDNLFVLKDSQYVDARHTKNKINNNKITVKDNYLSQSIDEDDRIESILQTL